MKDDALERWAHRAVLALRDLCDEAQEAAGNPAGEDQCPDLRALIAEFHAIERGWGDWQRDLALTGQSADGELDL